MSESMWDITIKNKVDVITPDEIVEEQCRHLSTKTDGRVLGKVSRYDGPTIGYIYNLSSLALDPFKKKNINSPDSLNEIDNDSRFAFDFSITSISTPHYKYRVMILVYELDCYPTAIDLDDDIASEIGMSPQIMCKSEEEFKITLRKILGSPKISRVVNFLNSATLREERRAEAV